MMRKVLLILFIILYASVAFVSTWHAIAFFGLANNTFLSILLAVTFEVGQAAVLFTLLYGALKKNWMPWVLMGILTAVQVLGNVFSSYKYLITENMDQISYFTNSVLFFVKSPNPDYNYVMISYITGAILPVVALCLTAIVVNVLNQEKAVQPETINNQSIIYSKEEVEKPSELTEKEEDKKQIFI